MKIALRSQIKLGVLFLLGLVICSKAISQDYFLPVNKLSLLRIERSGLHLDQNAHFGIKPVIKSSFDVSAVEGVDEDSTKYYYWITEKLFGSHLVELRKDDFKVNADFIFDFGYGQETRYPGANRSDIFTNTRGFAISAQIGKRVYLYTDFRENQVSVPSYLNDFADSLQVLPGTGQFKPFKEDGYDYNMANAYVGVNVAKWMDISIGHFEQFVGYGRRSLLFSDNSFNYPFASYTLKSNSGKWQYRYSLGLLQNLERLPLGDAPESLFKRKIFSMNYLSYKPSGKFEVGIFESIIWKSYDDSTGSTPFNFQSLVPIPLINTGINGLQSTEKNSVIGLNTAWNPTKNITVYGQYMLDDLDIYRFGYQLGIKYRSIFKVLDLNAEFNTVEAFSYTNEENLQSFSHSNQALAHPMGAGFSEYLLSLTYYKSRFLVEVDFVYATFSDQGRDILKPTSDQGISLVESVNYQNFKLAYVMNPYTNMQIYAGITNRIEMNASLSNTNQFWYFGIRTNLANVYTDF